MKEKILSSLLTVLAFSTLQAQMSAVPASPRLVVGITIDQLRADYLEAFTALYGEDGFKRLWREGRVYNHVAYNFSPVDRASALAAIYSGTVPAHNGIVAGQWLDRSTLRTVNAMDDRNYMGYYTAENSSPKNLLASTVTDELEIATQGKSLVYAIAPQREAAIMAAGHAADGAFWLNDLTGKWCGSTYYGNFPKWLMVYNDNNSTDSRIGNIQWETLYRVEAYDNPAKEKDFSYTFADSRKYRDLKVSPCVNDEVNRVAEACLNGALLGADPVTDFLSLTYNAGSYHSVSGQTSYLEMQDTYARLDQDIASLLKMIDKRVGLKNTLVFVTSTGYVEKTPADGVTFRIPTGEFHMNRATALLNMYLMALYGEGNYVEAYDGLHIYIDHKLIEKKQLRLKEVLDCCAEFLADLSGVRRVYTSFDFKLGAWSPELDKVKNAFHPARSGDIMLEVNNGWCLIDAEGNNHQTVRETAGIDYPLIFMGAGIEPDFVPGVVTHDRIAPTLSRHMRIRAPNACSVSPLADKSATNKP